jgi:hypothetical protein
VIADGFSRDAVVLEQLVCVARVFARDQVHVFEDLECAMRDICKVADRRRYQIESARHKKTGLQD